MSELSDESIETILRLTANNKNYNRDDTITVMVNICLGQNQWCHTIGDLASTRVRVSGRELSRGEKESINAYVRKHIEPALKLGNKDMVRIAVTAAITKMIDKILRKPHKSFNEIAEDHSKQLITKRTKAIINRIAPRNKGRDR